MDDGFPPDDLPAGAVRARLLAELALAVEQAQRAANDYEFTDEHAEEARALTTRLEAIRLEVEELRRGGWRTPVQELGSKRINLGPKDKS